ncbi:MAG TPA: TonB-dependent receptor [Blastocatellia bacterium]
MENTPAFRPFFRIKRRTTQALKRTFSLMAMACLFVSLAHAQTLDTATVRGQILDANGAAISGAEVTIVNELTGLKRSAQSDTDGHYSIAGLPLTGHYKLSISKAGFAGEEIESVELRAGETATFDVTLKPEGSHSEVTVFGTTEGVRSDSPQLSTRLDLQKIDNTPIFGRKITSLPLLNSAVRPARGTGDLFLNNTLFVINGSGRRQTSFTIDGSTGDDSWGRQTIFTNLPFSAIQEFTVLTSGFSPEYGRSTGSVINIVTKSGTNDYHGDLLGLWRPPGIQARNTLSIRRTADRLFQTSGAFSGPIVRDRTHFFVSAEYNRQDRDSTITSPLAPGTFRGHARQGLFIGRVDHQINASNSLTARANFDRLSDTNPADAVGGNALPSAARTFRRRAYAAGISETAVINDHLVNEARFQFQLGDPITEFEPQNPSTQFVRPGLATEGESRSAKLINHQYQLADTFSFTRSRHSMKFGVDAIYSSSGGNGQEFGGGFVRGQFTLKPGVTAPISELTINDVQRFTQSFGNASYNVKEWLWSVFAEDSIRLRRDLTVNLGLRYEQQTFTDDDNNVSPRLGFAYNFRGDSRTVIRGGYGIYYSEIRANLAASYLINGPTGIFSFSAAPGQLGFPTSLNPLTAFPPGAVLPPRDINIRPGQRAFLSQFFDVSRLRGYPDELLNPYTQLFTLGVEHDFGRRWILSADYVHQRTIKIDRPADLNAPDPFTRTAPGQVRTAAAADLTRPIRPVPNGFRRIIATINEAASNYDALQLNLNKRFGNSFSLLASYTYSHTINTVETDAPGQDPNDSNQLGVFERANSLLDQRHRAVISGWWQLPAGFTVGEVTTLASGRPFNVTTGVDNNGDGSNTDRPVIGDRIAGRNIGRGTAVYDVSLFAEKVFVLPGERAQISLRAEGFNLFNHSNIVGRNGVFGNDPAGTPLMTFGQALGGINNVDPGREFQFQVRLRF